MADTPRVNEIKPEEISITFVCSKYPRKLIKYLISQGHNVEKKEVGIYYVYGEKFAIQIVVNPTLSEERNLWLKNLTNEISDTASVEKLARAYESKKENTLYSSVMDILIRSNVAKFSEVKNMCEALKELYKEELEERYSQGIINTLLQLVRDGLLNLSIAAERAQMSVEEFQKKL